MAEGRLGKDKWKGSSPQLHTPEMSSEILPDTLSIEVPEGLGEWIESNGRQHSSPAPGWRAHTGPSCAQSYQVRRLREKQEDPDADFPS